MTELGQVTVPSGVLVVVDTGLLDLWTHGSPPLMPRGFAPPDVVERSNSAVDLRIVGPDAERAARALEPSATERRDGAGTFTLRVCRAGVHVFDVPRVHLEAVRETFDGRAQGLDASLEVLEQRVTHRARVELAVVRGGGVVTFHRQSLVAVPGLPTDRPLRVTGERRLDDGNWRFVRLEVEHGAEVTSAVEVGAITVEQSRAMFMDAEALGAWQHEEPLDGLADFVIWGVHGPQLAQALAAPARGDGWFGWANLPIAEAAALSARAQGERSRLGLRWAPSDLRPHSHHYYVMDQIRTTPTDSAVLEVGGARLVAFSTFGDGIFSVVRELDRSGRLVGLRLAIDD